MTSRTRSRVAGMTFLLYIAVGVGLMVFGAPTGSGDIAGKLALIAQHSTYVRVTMVIAWLMPLCALVLAVTLYGITRDVDQELAALVMVCRAGEGVVGAVSTGLTAGLLWLATEAAADAQDSAATHLLGAFLVRMQGPSTQVSAVLFAAGSTVFSWLLLRGRLVPVSLALLGVGASLLVLVLLPLRLAGFPGGPLYVIMWLPMLVFEVVLALWLIVRGVALPAASPQREGPTGTATA